MLIIIFSFLLLLYIYKENYFLEKTVSESNKDVLLSLSSSDLVKPKFSIKGKKDSISVSANHGNFITKDKILLKNKVKFETKNFKIISNQATFNKKNQTASSNTFTEFESKGAKISSQGFNITNSGNVIYFKGKTKIILSK